MYWPFCSIIFCDLYDSAFKRRSYPLTKTSWYPHRYWNLAKFSNSDTAEIRSFFYEFGASLGSIVQQSVTKIFFFYSFLFQTNKIVHFPFSKTGLNNQFISLKQTLYTYTLYPSKSAITDLQYILKFLYFYTKSFILYFLSYRSLVSRTKRNETK